MIRSLVSRCLLVFSLLITIGDSKDTIVVSEPENRFIFQDLIRPTVDLRSRYEVRDQTGLDKAHAETIRGRFGLVFNDDHPFSAFVEYEGTLAADRNSYQAASVHGLGLGKAVIADPESHEVNRLWLAYQADSLDTSIKVGRQRILLDNQRFVGPVGWRQNEQTFDAVALKNTAIDDLEFTYHHISQVNRLFGSGPIFNPAQTDFEGNTNLFHFAFTGVPETRLSTYAYFMDLENLAGHVNSNQTFGFSLERKIELDSGFSVPLYGEFAYQEDAFDSPLNYQTTYYHLSTGIQRGKHGVTVGFERLGSDNGTGFRTPLATLHKFNGFNDQFLVTPGNGLSDLYVGVHTMLPGGISLKPGFHWFGPAGRSLNFGSEFDIVAARKINDHLTILTKYSRYMADRFGVDTDDFTIGAGFTY